MVGENPVELRQKIEFLRNRCERGTWEYRARAARLAELGGVVG
jgi:hypothetical protein